MRKAPRATVAFRFRLVNHSPCAFVRYKSNILHVFLVVAVKLIISLLRQNVFRFIVFQEAVKPCVHPSFHCFRFPALVTETDVVAALPVHNIEILIQQSLFLQLLRFWFQVFHQKTVMAGAVMNKIMGRVPLHHSVVFPHSL